MTTKAAAAGRAGPSVVLAAWAWPLLLSRLCAGVRRAAARRPGRRSARPPQDLLLAGSTSSTGGLFWLSRITAHASYASGLLGPIPATGAGLGLPDPRPLRVRPASALEDGGRGLHLIEEVSSSWGACTNATGNAVWAELAPGL